MSARRVAPKKKKGKDDLPAEVVAPPVKSDEELLQEQLAATLLTIEAPVVTRPLHSPADVLLTLSLDDVLRFCFPAGVQHPASRGRLCVLANQGPIIRRHTYTACLCAKCQAAVRERRKEDEYSRRVFNGEAFTAANIPPRKSKATAASAAATSDSIDPLTPSPRSHAHFFPPLTPLSAAASGTPKHAGSSVPASVPALSIQHSPSHSLSGTAAFPVFTTSSPSGTMRSQAFAASAASTQRTELASPTARAAPHATLHNTCPAPFDLHPEYDSHTVDQLDYLCASCLSHARSQAHVFGGIGGKNVLGALQVNELARRIEDEDLLRAYDRWQVLSPAEERDFIAKLDGEKVARARLNYTREQMEQILSAVPRLRDEQGCQTDRMDFYAIQKVVNAERATLVKRLGEMYPDVATKGDKSLQASAITLQHVRVRGNSAKFKDKSQPQVNGVSWKGESILTTAMLQRQYPPHQSYALRTRLLHKHTHDVVPLGPGVNHSSVQLSVMLMRNQHANDHTEGWVTHF